MSPTKHKPVFNHTHFFNIAVSGIFLLTSLGSIAQTREPATGSTLQEETVHTKNLRENDNLKKFSVADVQERAEFSKKLEKKIALSRGEESTLPQTRFLINCMLDLANNGGDGYKINEAARICLPQKSPQS